MAKHYQNDTMATSPDANWLIADGVVSEGHALRSMINPGSAYVNHPILGDDPQPKHMRDYISLKSTDPDWDNGGVHINSGIPNHAFYLAATTIGGYTWEKTGKIWLETHLKAKQNDDFSTFAISMIDTAQKLYDSDISNLIGKAWQNVGVDLRGVKPPKSLQKSTQPEFAAPSKTEESVQSGLIKNIKPFLVGLIVGYGAKLTYDWYSKPIPEKKPLDTRTDKS